MSVFRLRIIVVALLLAGALGLTGGATAALEIRETDASAYPTVRATVVSPEITETPPVVEENGRPVVGLEAHTLAETKSVVLAIDTSHSMRGQSLIDAARAARSFLGAKPANDRIALTSFGSEARVLTEFSSSTISADAALRQLAVDEEQGTALYDAVVISAEALAAEQHPARVIIVLTDGHDVSSVATLEDAIAAARRAGASVYPIGIEGPQFSPNALEEIAQETGGAYYGAASSEALTQAYSSIADELRRTWQLEYITSARPGEEISLVATARDGSSEAVNLRAPGSPPRNASDESGSPLVPAAVLDNPWAPTVVALIVGLIALIASLLVIRSARGSWVRTRVDPHVEQRRTVQASGAERERFAPVSLVVGATERTLGQKRFFLKLQRKLERADIPLQTAEFLYVIVGIGLLVGIVAAIAGVATQFALVAMALGALLPYLVVSYRARRRIKEFENQLPDLLVTMAASLKAGHSFRQAIQTVVDEGADPASSEFKRVLTETRLGRSMEASLADMSERVGSEDFKFVITAVNIQRTVGGSLAGLFDMVAETVRNRQQFRRKIKGLTAMGRMSAYVLIGLPFFIAAMITLINAEYMAPLFTTSTGRNLIYLGLGMMAVGSLLLKKIVSFKG